MGNLAITSGVIMAELCRSKWNYKTCGAVIGLYGGIGAALLGSIVTAIAWFTTWHGFALHRAGTVLLFLTIPLLLIGAHCQDMADKDRQSNRIHVIIQ
jgi:cobalamin biosynthesis protein CobD/CbiB